MNDGFPALDIIFFALVAVFLVLRLRSVLGRRTGNERRPPEGGWTSAPPPAENSSRPTPAPGDNVVDLASARKPPANIFDTAAPAPSPDPAAAATPRSSGLAAIIAADPDFSEAEFLSGARMAFEMIIAAYANGDKKTLRPLLADQVYASFAGAIDARARASEELTTELMGIRSVQVVDARLVGTFAHVTVRFATEQINVVKTLEGRVVDGDPSRIVDVVDDWTFQRDTRTRDPNWQLAGTRAPQATETGTTTD